MNGKSTSWLIAVLIIMGGLLGFITFETEVVSAYLPHDPIFIDGNVNFTTGNGVIGGSGTALDPYIIEGWEINASFVNGIEVRNTDDHFIIQDVNLISDNTGYVGILFNNVTNGIIQNTTSSNYNDNGIYLYKSSGNIIRNNTISNINKYGIEIQISSNNLLINNTISDSTFAYGLVISSSTDINLTNNNFIHDGVFIGGSQIQHFNTHIIPINNMVNNKPLYYYKNLSGFSIDNVSLGELILANCSFVNIENLEIHDVDLGIEVAWSNNITISNNNITNINYSYGGYGIYLYYSSYSVITQNEISGICLGSSVNNYISHNDISNNGNGITLGGSNNIVTKNNISNNSRGINVAGSSDLIIDNDISDNYYGLMVRSSFNNITNNKITNNYWGLEMFSTSYTNILNNNITRNNYGIQIGYLVNNNFISSNNISDNQKNGIYLDHTRPSLSSNDNIIINNSILRNGDNGISFYKKSNNTLIVNNTIRGNVNNGIYLTIYSSNNSIINNNILNNGNNGIHLYLSSNNSIEENEVLNNNIGFYFDRVSNVNASNNIISNNSGGIFFGTSSHNIISNNTLTKNGDGIYFDSSSDNIILSNNISSNTGNGILLWDFSNNNNIRGNVLSRNNYGIYSPNSNGTIIINNKVSNNSIGLLIYASSNDTIMDNDIVLNGWAGIYLHYPSFGYISRNNISFNGLNGIYSVGSSNMTISDNNFTQNYWGLYLDSCFKVNITENNFEKDGVVIVGSSTPHFNSHTIPSNNKVNGKPIYYYKDLDALVIDDIELGQLIIVNSTSIESKNLTINNTDIGIQLAFVDNGLISGNNISSNDNNGITIWHTSNVTLSANNVSENWAGIGIYRSANSTVFNNNAFNNKYGIYPSDSSHIIIRENNISSNYWDGIRLWQSDNISIYFNNITLNENYGIYSRSTIDMTVHHNFFIKNSNHSYDDMGVENSWDDDYPNGGNYWDNYTGLDQYSGPDQNLVGSDGIGDDPFLIDDDSQDNYPLMQPSSFLPPSAPQNLQAFSADSYVNLSWLAPYSNGSFPITNYRIYRRTSLGSEIFLTEIGNIPYYNDTTVSNSITYFYKISAVNMFDEGSMSNEASAIPGVPTEPKSLTTESGDSYISLSWNPPDSEGGFPITNYIIYRGNTSGEETFLTEIGDILYYNDTAVTNGIRYYYKVSARNVIGEGHLSDEVSGTPATFPTSPLNLITQAGDFYVNLNWDAPSSDGGFPIINYRIYRRVGSTEYSFLFEVENIVSFNDTSVLNGITYHYRISAVNTIGEGPYSNEAEGTPLAVPSKSTSLMAITGDSYVNLIWNGPNNDGGSPITGYRIFRGTSLEEFFFLEEIGNITTYNDTTVINDLIYYYKISAVNEIGEGSSSDSIETKAFSSSPLNHHPTCSFSNLSSGMTISGIFEISGSASDSDGTVQYVEIRINDGEWMRASGTTSWKYTLDTKSLVNGEHRIHVRSYDAENYSQEENVNVIINNRMPSEEKSFLQEGWIWFLIIIIIIAAIIIVFFFQKMRKKPTEDIDTDYPKERENEA